MAIPGTEEVSATKVSEERHEGMMLASRLLALAREVYYLAEVYAVRRKKAPKQLNTIINGLKALAAKELTRKESKKIEKVLSGEDAGLGNAVVKKKVEELLEAVESFEKTLN